MSLLVALGNPGSRYVHTRHNVAWWVVERLEAKLDARPFERALRYDALRAESGGRELHLVRPLTYMNLSGEALLEWEARHGLDRDALLVVSDDVYLPVGSIRIRRSGSSGGHLGLESIEAALGSRDYARLRIGVGGVDSAHLRDHVLAEFSEDEAQAVEDAVTQAAEAVEVWLREGLVAAMNRFNRRTGQEASES